MTVVEKPRAAKPSQAWYSALTKVDGWLFSPNSAVALVFAALAFRLLRIVNHYGVNIFFSDHWAIENATLFEHHSWLEIFRWQHGWHRQGLGGVLLAIFEPLTRWNERSDGYLAVAIITVACAAALLLKRRLFGPITYWDVVIPLLFFTPTQYETFIGPLNLAYAPLPTLLVVLFCLSWTIANEGYRYAALLVINFLCVYTGFALLLGLLTPFLFAFQWVRTRRRTALLATAVTAASLASYAVGLHSSVTEVCYSVRHPAIDYVVFLVILFSQFAQISPVHVTAALFFGVGTICILLIMLVGSLRDLGQPGVEFAKERVVISVLLGFSLLFSFATDYGRSCAAAGAAPRYMTYLVLGFLGLYFGSISIGSPVRRTISAYLLLMTALFSSAFVGEELQRYIATVSERQQLWKDCYLSTHDSRACDARSGSIIYANPEPADLQAKLDYLEQHRLNLFARR